MLQKTETKVKVETAAKTIEKLEKIKDKRPLTVAEKRIIERAKYLKQQKSKIKPKTEIKTVTKSGSYLYTASAAAGMDPDYSRYPVSAIVPGIRNLTFRRCLTNLFFFD